VELSRSSARPATPRIGLLLLACGSGWALVVINNLMVGLLLVELRQEFGVPLAQAGQVVAVYGFTAGLAAPLIGRALDRFGRRPLMLAGLATLFAANVAAALAPSFAWLLAARAAAALGTACLQPAAFALVGDVVPYARRGWAMGWVMNGSTFANLAGVPITTLVAGMLGWRWAFALAAALSLVATTLVLAGLRGSAPAPTPPAHPAGPPSQSPRAALRPAVATTLAFFLGSLAWFAWLTYLAAFYRLRFGVATAELAPLVSAIGLGLLVGINVGGRLGDRWGQATVVAAANLLAALLLALLTTLVGSLWLALAMNIALAIPTGARFSAQNALQSETLPRARGTAMAVATSALQWGILAGSLYGGWLIEGRGLSALGPGCAVAALLAAAIAWLGARDVGQPPHRLPKAPAPAGR
jgi:predicted MFS family arabinose efflux permease